MDLGHLDFDIVSDFDIRISYFSYRDTLHASRNTSFKLRDTLHASRDTNLFFTTVERALQIRPFMQNKANFRKSQMNVNKVLTKDYEKKDTWWSGKKQSQTNPNKAKFKKAKMNVSSYITKGYENKSPIRAPEKTKPSFETTKTNANLFTKRDYEKYRTFGLQKTNPNKPKQTQTNPMLARHSVWQACPQRRLAGLVRHQCGGSKAKKCCCV